MASAASITITAKDEAGNVLSGISRSLAALKGAGDEARGGISSLGSALDSLKSHIGTGAAIATGIGLVNTAMGALARTMGGVKDSFIGINEQLDASKVAFTGMLGSAQASTAMLKQLQTLAAQTPFEFPQLVTATQHLMSFGFTAQQTIPLLKDIGNASSYFGTGAEGINRMVLAMGQMHAGVVLHTQDLDQLIQVGVPVWNILAEGTGKNTAELQKMVSNGQIASDTFIQYFDQWVQKTPGVVDAMQKQSTTFAGAMSTIHDNATMAIATGLRPLFDLITEGANKIAQFTEGDRFQSWVQMVEVASGRAADAIRNMFKEFQQGGLSSVLDDLKGKIEGALNIDGTSGGQNFIVTFVTGMYDAAQGVLTTALNDITSYIADFFIGHSPPPKGPLSGILDGGAKTMEAFLDGMMQAVQGGGVSTIAGGVFTLLNDVLTRGLTNVDFSSITDAIRTGTMSMDELKVAGEGVDDVVRRIGDSITDLQDKQDGLKGQIDDITYSYQSQIDPLQKQIDALKNVVDWTTKRRDLELEIANNQLDQQQANDPTLKGLSATLAQLQGQQQSGRTAPIDRTIENRIAALQAQERGLPSGTAGTAQRTSIEDTIATLRDQQRRQSDADTDAARALQSRIDAVKSEIDARKQVFQSQIDANKAEKDSIDLKQQGLDLQRQLAALPLEQKVAQLKAAEQDRLAPLQKQYDLLDRQRQVLEQQKKHWQEIGQEMKDALQPLQDALKAQQQLEAEQKKASATTAAGTKAGALGVPAGLQLRGQETGTGNPLGDALTTGIKGGAAQVQFETMGGKLGEWITNGAVSYIKDHFGSLIGGAIGTALGDATLGPVGALIGGLLGSKIGDELQKQLGTVDWDKELEPITHAWTVFKGVITGDWGDSITNLTIDMGGMDGAAAMLAKTLREDVWPMIKRVGDDMKDLAGWLDTHKDKIKSDTYTAWGESVDLINNSLTLLETAFKVFGDVYVGDWNKLWYDIGITTTNGTKGQQTLIDDHLHNVTTSTETAHKTWLNDWGTLWDDIWSGTHLKFDGPLAVYLKDVFGPQGMWAKAFSDLGTTTDEWFGPDGKIGKKFSEFGATNKRLWDDIVNGIGDAWSGLAGLMATPINDSINLMNSFVDAVVKATNAVLDFFGIDKKISFTHIPTLSAPAATKHAPTAGGGGASLKATGDLNFAGGQAIIGEQGRELYNNGNGWEMAERATLLNLPKGATVLPNAVTEMLLKMGVPGFAGGILGDIGGGVINLAGNALDTARKGADAIYDATVGKLPDLNLPGAFADVGPAIAEDAKKGLKDLIGGLLPKVGNLASQLISGAANALFASPTLGITAGSGNWHNPVPGYRAVQGSWTHGGTHDHEAAVDWATPLGTPILAPDAGIAATVQNGDGATGRTGVINHLNGWITYFGHVRDFAGGARGQDDLVGHTGSPEEDGGAGSGAHLHFAMRLNGAYMRPEDYIPGIFGLSEGGVIKREGPYYLHKHEAVIPLDKAAGAGAVSSVVFQPGAIVVRGTVVSEQELTDAVYEGLVRKQRREGSLRFQ